MELNNMTKPIIRIHNAETNEIIDREMTNTEFAQYEIDQANAVAEKAEVEAKAQAKATAEVKIDALGLTTNYLRALGL